MRRYLSLALALVMLLLSTSLMLAQSDSASSAPAIAFPLSDLVAKLAAIFAPALSSAIVWFFNKRTTLMSNWPNMLKVAAYLVMGTAGGWLGARFGLDMSSVGAFVTSALTTLSGLAIFHLGKNSPSTK